MWRSKSIELSRGDNMSSKEYLSDISKRLEKGWTLLNQHCPMTGCATPLLRDPKGQVTQLRTDGVYHRESTGTKPAVLKVYCAKCEIYCITPKEAQCLGPSDDNTRVGLKGAHSNEGKSEANSSRKTREGARAAAEVRMGENLLLGWTMLADVCPIAGCFFPLMLDPGRNTVCVACGEDSAVLASAFDVTPAMTTDAMGSPASRVLSETAAPSPDYDKLEAGERPLRSRDEFAAAARKRDWLSATLGRYMLQGWSLLDKTCPREECTPGTPLLKKITTGTLYCAACDTRMCERGDDVVMESTSPALPLKRDSSGESRNLEPRAQAVSVSKIESMQSESEYELAEKARLRKQAARDRSDNRLTASAGLAERLLQGWAMLSKACPRAECHSPLMRDRNGTEICVSCSATHAEGDAGGSPAQAAGDVMGETGTEEETEEDREMVDGGAGCEYANQRKAELTGARAGHDNIDHGGVRKRALNSLYMALDVSQQSLSACAGIGSLDVDECARRADLIAKLALTIRAVFDLPTITKCG